MLIDQHDGSACLRNDVGLVHLRAGRTERTVEQFRFRHGTGGGGIRTRVIEDASQRASQRSGQWCLGRVRQARRVWRSLGAVGNRVTGRRPWLVQGRLEGRRLIGRAFPVGRNRRFQDANGCLPASDGRAVPGAVERIPEAADDQRPDAARIAEPHFDFGRVDVDIDLPWINRHEQRQQRLASTRNEIAIGRTHSPDHQFITHRTTVDK